MAYSSTGNPAYLLVSRVGGARGAVWGYTSNDSIASVAASGYVANGAALGMKVGDIVHVTQLSTADAYTAHATGRVSSVTASSAATVVFAATST